MGTEREVKLKVSHSEFLDILRKKGIAFKILDTIEQEDLYLDTDSCDLLLSGRALRVRIVGNAVRIAYKGPREGGGIEKAREEIEGQIGSKECMEALLKVGIDGKCPSNYGDLLAMLSKWGYVPKLIVWKMRTPLALEGFDVEVALDHVKDLGEFVEIEGEKAIDLVRLLGIACRAVIPSYADLIHALKQ